MRIKPKKNLGQNFLVDKNIQKKLIEAYNPKKTDRVLEIGAGYGELTKLIAENVDLVYALEIDRELFKILQDNTARQPNIKTINQDILKFNLNSYFKKTKGRIKVIGNIPYYITTPIIEHLFKYRNKIETIFLTVQKEFGRRIAAGPGSKEYGSFSCFVQFYAIPKIIFSIKSGCFFPPPKVDSCVLELKIRQEAAVKVNNKKLFFKVIRSSFNKRRKTLKNSLKGIIATDGLIKFFTRYNIDKNIRPEELSLDDFARLVNIID